MKIAETIKEIRSRLKMTQVELAEKVGTNQNFISLIESGKRQPSRDIIDKIGLAFGLTGEVIGIYAAELEDINPKHKDSFNTCIGSMRNMIDEMIDYELEKRENGKESPISPK